MKRTPLPAHTLLPPEAIASLQRAATADIPFAAKPNYRVMLIDKIVDRLRVQYPNRFRQE